MNKKIYYFALMVYLVPFIFVVNNDYVTGLGVYGSRAVHSVQYYGVYLFLVLLVFFAIGLLLGLIHPKISLWFGDPTRKKSVEIYGLLCIISLVGYLEVTIISRIIYKYEDSIIVSLYNEIDKNDSIENIKISSKKYSKNITFSYGILEKHKKTLGVRSKGKNKLYVNISFPGLLRSRRIIIEQEPPREGLGSEISRIYLMKEQNIESSK